MRALRTTEVAAVVSGRLVGQDRVVRNVVIDSRDGRDGSLFFALPGERTDGHRFTADALTRGAAACVIRRGVVAKPTSIVVGSPGEALLTLARSERTVLSGRVIGITGSVGKTTTKDLAAEVLRESFRVTASPRSFNNEIGVPLTLLDADEHTEVVVAEIGAGVVGEIAMLCEIARPNVGLITTVGSAHLETFGSLEAIARAKAELVEALPAGGLAILNADDRVVASFAERTDAAVLSFGRDRDAHVRADRVRLDARGHATFTLVHESERVDVRLGVIGEHMVTAALGAASCGVALGVSLDVCAARLENSRPSPGRMQELTTPRGVRILHDAYNANPMSMFAALRALAAARDGARAVAVLGPMAQLGHRSEEEHERMGRAAAALELDGLVVVGERARPVADGALEAGMARERVRWCLDQEEAIDVVRNSAAPDDIVLVKASRVAHLEDVVEALQSGR